MTLNKMTSLWARTALLWFVVAVCLGLFMGITQRFQFTPAHAHIGVLGWLSSGVYAFLHSVAREGRPSGWPSKLHWAAHTLGVAAMTSGLFGAIGLGMESMMALLILGSQLVVISVLWGAIMLWPRLAPRTD